MNTVVIARATVADAHPLRLGRLCRHYGLRGLSGVVRREISNAQR
jgi:hypothetical protein